MKNLKLIGWYSQKWFKSGPKLDLFSEYQPLFSVYITAQKDCTHLKARTRLPVPILTTFKCSSGTHEIG